MRFLLGLVALLFHGYRANAKAVFAHFMVSNALNYSQADWASDIQLAQAAHIDAFALNMAYNEGDDSQLGNAFSAADTAGFKLFFSFDYAGNGAWPKQEVIKRLTSYGSRGSYYQYNGKIFASTFEGPDSASDWIDIKASTNCYFVPDWSSLGAKEAVGYGNGVADGLFSWAAWPWGDQDMNTYTDASYLQYLDGRPYMMAVSPWFYTNLPGFNKNWLWRGDDLWFDRWQEVLYVQPEWVQIISWNDYGESHYIGPIVDKALGVMTTGRAPLNYVQNMPHDGWRLTLPYSIDMYVQNTTTITQEGVSVWYRIQPAAACNEGDTTGNTASQLQIEFDPASIVQDRVFFTAVLGSTADVSVSIGGSSQAATWSDVPDGNIGLYHGSAPFNGRSGSVVVTISRSGSEVASVTGVAITSTCSSGGLENWNAWVGSGTSPGSISAIPNNMGGQVCIRGTGVNNFAGLCSYGCGLGYCPIGACTCEAMGAQKPVPSPANINGYPAAGLSADYSGLCAFDCNMGYCPSGACTTVPEPLTTPTVSPFLPPACTAGTGSGNWAGLCSYACNYGFCPMHICTCTGQGALVQAPPVTLNVTGSPVGGVDDYGLCDFTCPRGYCPAGACTATNNTGSSSGTPVYIDPTIWAQPSPTVTCVPPCVIVLPPYTLPTPTTISFEPVTTTLTEAWVAGCVFTTVMTVTWSPITTTAVSHLFISPPTPSFSSRGYSCPCIYSPYEFLLTFNTNTSGDFFPCLADQIPVFNLNITSSGVDSVVYTVTPSVLPSTAVTFTPPSSCIPAMTSASTSTTPVVVVFTSTPDPSSTWPIVTGEPTTVHFSNAYPPGPTCTAIGGCGGSMCKHWCNSCGPVGCSGGDTYGGGDDDTGPGCINCGGTSGPPGGGGSSSGCVGPLCSSEDAGDDAQDDPCEFDTTTGMCDNGNYPVFDPSSGTVNCDGDSQIGQCQQNIDNNLAAVQSYLENEKACCPTSSKAKRGVPGSMLSSLLHRGLETLGLSRLVKRADYCPTPGQNPKQPPAGQCYATYTCPHALYPNVCGNAKSAINIRGAPFILTHVAGSSLHDTAPWYDGHFFSDSDATPQAGWKLEQCQVEEYPFGSGNPDRYKDGSSVLRLIPGGRFGQGWENQNAGIHLRRWIQSVATRYNNDQQQRTGVNPRMSVNGIVYCVDFDSSFTRYLPEDLVDENICASIYGPEFTLVNDYVVDDDGHDVRTWDPWFDVPNTDRKKAELMYYKDPQGNEVVGNPTDDDYAVYDFLPPTYCEYPSPGKHTFDLSTNSWVLAAGFQAVGRRDDIATNERCTDPPAAYGTRAKRGKATPAAGAEANQTRIHPRDLTSRQGTSGGFLDPNVYIWLGCGADDDSDSTEDEDPCADDSNPCGNAATNVPTTNGASPTQDPLPGPDEGGYSTGPITPTSPSFVPCSTRNADPDNGIAAGYCVCSGSTFAQSTDADVTPVNFCAYTSPLPASTTSIRTFTTAAPTTTSAQPAPTLSKYVLEIYAREILVASNEESLNTWWWECVSFDTDTVSEADVCDHNANPILYSSAIGGSSPTAYPMTLGQFSLAGHSSCSYTAANTATVGGIGCQDGLEATCTAPPAAQQTQLYDCSSTDLSNGVARDWWYWHISCEYD